MDNPDKTAAKWIRRWEYEAKYPEPEPITSCQCSVPGAMPPCSWCTDPDRTEDDFQ